MLDRTANVPRGRTAQAARATAAPELSVVVPVLNEERNVPLIIERLTRVLESCVASHEIVFVDDGSTDGTMAAIAAAAAADGRVRAVSFSAELRQGGRARRGPWRRRAAPRP